MIFKKRKLKPKYENLARLTAYMLFKLYENIKDFEKFKEHINNNMSFDIINDEFIIVKDSKYSNCIHLFCIYGVLFLFFL